MIKQPFDDAPGNAHTPNELDSKYRQVGGRIAAGQDD